MKKLFTLIISSVMLLLSPGCQSAQNYEPLTAQADYSTYFNGINGCAVFYDYDKNTYTLYNEDQCNTRYSPYSTFKIIATLEGLKEGVITSENSTMEYSGDTYSFESWNKNLDLKEAFKESCVWYFRQVIDGVGQETMAADLEKLNYGNCNVSQWEGEPINAQADLNGFWLDSSLEISPIEMVNVISDIFEGNTDYKEEHIAILKNIMKSDKEGIYGKTGTGKDGSAWYAGFCENGDKSIYFAVHLYDSTKKNIAGANAREIAENIITSQY